MKDEEKDLEVEVYHLPKISTRPGSSSPRYLPLRSKDSALWTCLASDHVPVETEQD